MQIIHAEALGFCFGVREAVRAIDRIERPELVTIRGELVHNPDVLADLARRGFHQQLETGTAVLPSTSHVLITAHGASDAERSRLEAAGKHVLDTTCPLVRRAHDAARRLANDGRHVIVIGRRGHVEVRGLIGDLPDYTIVESESEVTTWPYARLGVVCQTTTPPPLAEAVRRLIEKLNPAADIQFVNTVCQPTIDRREALLRLLPQVDLVVVVGGRNSNNTVRLVETCREQGTPAVHIEHPTDLNRDWFAGCGVVGVTAGTSTPDAVIEAVDAALADMTPPRLPPGGAWSSNAWCAYFKRNAENRPAIPWETISELTAAERRAVGRSIAVFQIGESGEGAHILRCAARHGRECNDPNYVAAVRLFIQEEQRHAALLGRFLDEAGLPRSSHDWTDGVFRRLRHLAGLELTVTVLVTAEILAQVYYAALRDATGCAALRALCRVILRDEVAHVRFQVQRIEILQQSDARWLSWMKRRLHAGLFAATALVVWFAHRRVFRAAEMSFRTYVRRCVRAFLRRRSTSEPRPSASEPRPSGSTLS